MEKNTYSISIEREALRCDNSGEISKIEHLKIFENKNKFITTSKSESQIKICTPKCENVLDCYIKLQEITDIVLLNVYNADELIWPSSKPCLGVTSELNSNIKFIFELNEESYNYIMDSNMPQTISKAYEQIKKQFMLRINELKEIYGDIDIEIKNNRLEIKNITINSFDRCGISLNDLMYLVSEIFACLINEYDLEKVNNKFSLKCKDGIKNELNERKTFKIDKLSRTQILKLAKKHIKIGYNEQYNLKYHPNLVSEAVALVKDALYNGIDYKVLNEVTSCVELNDNGHKEFVIEGNKTDKDSYIFPIITDDKLISKSIMKNNGLNVPNAILLEQSMEQKEKEELLKSFYNKCLVVKPRNTNKGVGIHVFDKPATKEQINEAVEYAFKFDKHVLIEEYIVGLEYRFLVVDGKCISVCHRRAASVVGDGKSTIKQLIRAKNKELWHSLTCTIVKSDKPVEAYLKTQGYNYDSILPIGKRVFLRKNTNCSTGGESIDATYTMPEYFKRISEKAANSFNAKIAGVDLIIDDINSKEYCIIEINDNPGYSINEWPYEGKGEKVGVAIMKLLGYLN